MKSASQWIKGKDCEQMPRKKLTYNNGVPRVTWT